MREFILPLYIYIEDTDYSGVVFHANYLKFFERGRSLWAEQLGFGVAIQLEQGIFFAVRYAHIDFLKPARLNDEMEVVTRVAEVRNASLIYEQYLRLKEQPDTILCKAEIKVACVDRDFRPRALPEMVKRHKF